MLTIEAGVTVQFAPGTALAVAGVDNGQGGLKIQGTSSQPVNFVSANASPAAGDWQGLYLLSGYRSDSSISGLNLQDCGGQGSSRLSACLVADGSESGNGTDFSPVLNNVTVTNSSSNGFAFLGHHTGPGVGSSNLTVNGWDSASAGALYPFVMEPAAAGKLPTSVVASGGPAGSKVVALVNALGGGFQIDVTQTWPAVPLPYLLTQQLDIGGSNAGDTAVLTIAAPNTILIGATSSNGILVSDGVNFFGGTLLANGTAANHIKFTAAGAAPNPGSWSGIDIELAGGGASSSLTYCDISYAGGQLTTGGSDPQAQMVVSSFNFNHSCSNTGPTISNCTFANLSTNNVAIDTFGIQASQVTAYQTGNSFPSGLSNPVFTATCQ